MKVETPQILWNSEGDKGKNAPLYSVALQDSGAGIDGFTHILATAGNTNEVNLWRVSFTSTDKGYKSGSGNGKSKGIFHSSAIKPFHQIEYVTSLSRHDLPVNTVSFSPDGLHLVTAGEAGSIILWSVPVQMRGNNNGRHFWSTVTKESNLSVRIVSTACEGVCDISWSQDSKRFVVGTIDNNVLIYEDKHYAVNSVSPQKESEWGVVFRNGEHSSFVQGVTYDPLGVYVASMGSDRTVRVFPRKTPTKSKKKALRPANAPRVVSPPQDHQRMVSRLLTDSKIEMGKTKRIQRRCVHVDSVGAQIKQRLFADESTCESFFRRLSWTTDGLFLITPCALWHEDQHDENPSFSTYIFARHRFDEPYKVLPGLEKPSVVVRPNPKLFQMPSLAQQEDKENPLKLPYRSVFAVLTLDTVLIYDTYHNQPLAVARGLHYAGLTDCSWSQDGLNLVVCSTDGYISILSFDKNELGSVYVPPVTSESITVDKAPCSQGQASISQQQSDSSLSRKPSMTPPYMEKTLIPPCEAGQTAILEAPPTKRAKTRVTPTLLVSTPSTSKEPTGNTTITPSKRPLPTSTDEVGDAVDKLSLSHEGTLEQRGTQHLCKSSESSSVAKKKKRIQPMLISN